MLLFFVLELYRQKKNLRNNSKAKNKSIVDTVPTQKTKALSIQFQNKQKSIVDTVPKTNKKSNADTVPKQKTKALSLQFQKKKLAPKKGS
jgi:hypothetical protein